MYDIITQIITTLCLITGVISGEALSNRLFGLSKKWFLNIIEIFIFITLLVLLFNNVYLTELNIIALFLINFFFGISAITITRGITSLGGFFSKRIKEKYFLNKELNQDIIIIGLARNLLYKGLSKEEIISIFQNSGLDKKKTRNNVSKLKIDKEEVFGTEENRDFNS